MNFFLGTSVIYPGEKTDSNPLASVLSTEVSGLVGTINRGPMQDSRDLTVLHKTRMTAVLVEIASLSGSDEQLLHQQGAISAGSGIANGIIGFFGP